MKKKNIFWGLAFIVLAAVIILKRFGIFAEIGLFDIVVTILLIPIFVLGLRKMEFPLIFFPLAIAGILFDKELGIEVLTPWPIIFAALFLSVGMSILFPKNKGLKKSEYIEAECRDVDDEEAADGEEGDEVVNITASFTGNVKYIESKNLKRVNVNASFSGIELYFDNAEFDKNGAVINLNISFAGAKLYFPKNCIIIDKTDSLIGGVKEGGNRNGEKTGATVTIEGRLSFSGVEIIYV